MKATTTYSAAAAKLVAAVQKHGSIFEGHDMSNANEMYKLITACPYMTEGGLSPEVADSHEDDIRAAAKELARKIGANVGRDREIKTEAGGAAVSCALLDALPVTPIHSFSPGVCVGGNSLAIETCLDGSYVAVFDDAEGVRFEHATDFATTEALSLAMDAHDNVYHGDVAAFRVFSEFFRGKGWIPEGVRFVFEKYVSYED